MYTTDENVRDFFDVPETIATTEIKQYIRAISVFMDKKVGYKLAHYEEDAVQDVLLDGSGEKFLDFGSDWISEFATVLEDDIDITDNIVAYPLNKPFKNYLMKKDSIFAEGLANIKLTDAKIGAYVVDWRGSGHTLPHDLELACKTLVVSVIKYKINKAVRTAGNITQEKTSQYSISYGGATGENSSEVVEAMNIISNYKEFFIA